MSDLRLTYVKRDIRVSRVSRKRTSTPIGARIRACDTSIASSRRDESIGTGLADKICEFRDLWLPEIRKILDLARGQLLIDWYRSRRQDLRVPGFMASGNPENPGFGQGPTAQIYGFRKSGKSWIWPGANCPVGARIRACDTSIASSRRDESIGTGLADKICEFRDLWLPEIRKILDLAMSQISRRGSDPGV
ncbi:hypothetical protein DdX_02575 [Ditylenchus destructor]|uniref:Uncharacterized protein n=1 Tax=Ditylenchus destructor TaxID=166010 RepID=A0AAD4NBG9_9BILA|nr:hypothetical protein DdX_02575 [Ditylenchus destructor]